MYAPRYLLMMTLPIFLFMTSGREKSTDDNNIPVSQRQLPALSSHTIASLSGLPRGGIPAVIKRM